MMKRMGDAPDLRANTVRPYAFALFCILYTVICTV